MQREGLLTKWLSLCLFCVEIFYAGLIKWWHYFFQPYPRLSKTLAGGAMLSGIYGIIIIFFHIMHLGLNNLVIDDTIQTPAPKIEKTQEIQESYEIASTVPWRFGLNNFVRGSLHNEGLPYTDAKTVNDAIKQIDYALTQTVLRLNMPWNNVKLTSYERNTDQVLLQRLRIYLSIPPVQFADNLKQMLELWAESAHMQHIGGDHPFDQRIRILVDKQLSHEIFLSPLSPTYVQPKTHKDQPKLAIVIDDLGESNQAFEKLLSLKFPFNAAIWPWSNNSTTQAEQAWQQGHDVIIHMPMEPLGYPKQNPGKDALLSRMSDKTLRQNLNRAINRMPRAVGLSNHMGSKLTTDSDALAIICNIAKDEGLMVLDSLTNPKSIFAQTARDQGLTVYRRNVFLDDMGTNVTEESVLAFLKESELLAKKNGQAIAIGHPHPQTLAALEKWLKIRDKSIDLVPLRFLSSY